MHIVIITKSLPPSICGIGDHTLLLGEAIRAMGHRVSVVAGNGSQGRDVYIEKDFWMKSGFERLEDKIETLKPDHLILQYTPMMYAPKGWGGDSRLVDFWAKCPEHLYKSIILHETYFRAWWHPPSLIRGTREKLLLKAMVKNSHNVFTASQPLCEEIARWPGSARVCLLPIGANFIFRLMDREKLRAERGVAAGDIVLTLFGGGDTSLRKLSHYVNATEKRLSEKGISVRWLLLGGVKKEIFTLKSPVLSPGFMSSEEFGQWLQLADVFLMPQIFGLSAKRGTLMAALQHGLPVVGTLGKMTDKFWADVPGINLVSSKRGFVSAVLALAENKKKRAEMGETNRKYFEAHLTWEKIAGTLLERIAC